MKGLHCRRDSDGALQRRSCDPHRYGGWTVPLFVWVIAGLLLVLLLVTLVTGRDEPEATQQTADRVSTPASIDPASAEESASASGASSLPASGVIEQALEEAHPSRNPIERARNATVFLQTSWGAGSGFFVSDDCRIVTNRHVVEYDPGVLEAMESELAAAETSLEEARRFVAKKARRFNSKCRDCSQEAWEQFLGDDLEAIDRYDELLFESRNELLDIRYYSAPTAILADGSEHPLSIERISDRYDLALARIEADGCPALPTADEDALELGERLYTVGSPRGIRHKVTSGVFSGFIEEDGLRVLQTDAPINPGNSGGPLIDEDGRAVGVNTAVLVGSRGIGLAIPISLVLDEFRLDR